MTKTHHNFLPISLRGKNPSKEEFSRFIANRIDFDDWQASFACLQRIIKASDNEAAVLQLLPALLVPLADAASPDRALINFERFLGVCPDKSSVLRSLAAEPRLVETLTILFAGSQYLTDILLRYPHYFDQIEEGWPLRKPKTRQELVAEAEEAARDSDDFEGKLDALRRYQRREYLRLGSSDLMGLLDLSAVAAQLSSLAISLIRVALAVSSEEAGIPADEFAVIGLGKLGGRELNYSSDIDLLFLSKESTARDQRLGERVIQALAKTTPEGFLYRVDMRLRPWGQVGTLVPSIAENLRYLRDSAQVWEKQAMYKGRAVAGNEILAIEFLQQAKSFVSNLDSEAVRAEMKRMKEKMEGRLKRRGREWGEVKAGAGSIRDVEFVTQYLQQIHGKNHPEVHSRNTLDGLARLRTCGILPIYEYRTLSEGYTFLRSTEHHLQIMHHRQTHLLPTDARELRHLARRLGFVGNEAEVEFVNRYKQHSSAIREIYKHYILSEPKKSVKTAWVPREERDVPLSKLPDEHISRMDMAYTAAFSEEDIQLHIQMAGRLSRENPLQLRAERLGDLDWRITIVAFDYMGELSLICGLLFDYGLNILEGHIFTYEPEVTPDSQVKPSVGGRGGKKRKDSRRKIVDVFSVRSLRGPVSEDIWQEYSKDLTEFVSRLREKQQREVHGDLAKRIAKTLGDHSEPRGSLRPIDIAIDNHVSRNYTVLRIDAPDSIGFMFELTNALALNGFYIARVVISSLGHRVHDTLFITDIHGNKITDPQKQHYLRVATALVQHFIHLLPSSPNPESALLHFGEFVANLFSQQEWPKELASLDRPDLLAVLAKLLGVSDFLWNDFLRIQHENLFPVLKDLKMLNAPKSKETLDIELVKILDKASSLASKRTELNAFKDREMFRIDMRFINGLVSDFGDFTEELSDLAEVIIEAACRLNHQALLAKFGVPRLDSGAECRFCLCALGKFGGREMGVASDIELMFIYEGVGQTTDSKSVSNAEFFEKLVNEIRLTVQAKHAGIFEIDLRLRPYGSGGNLAVLFDSFKKYYASDGPAWDYERQALVKLRPILGAHDFCCQITDLRDAYLYESPDLNTLGIRGMRERQVRQLVVGGTVNAKFSPGGLVDLEYLVQSLQLKHGAEFSDLRVGNTSVALQRLAKHGILSDGDCLRLSEAHLFLRRLIEGLRIVRGNAKDLTVPDLASQNFAFLARRLEYGQETEKLHEDLMRNLSVVQDMSRKALGE